MTKVAGVTGNGTAVPSTTIIQKRTAVGCTAVLPFAVAFTAVHPPPTNRVTAVSSSAYSFPPSATARPRQLWHGGDTGHSDRGRPRHSRATTY
ncbi:MAG: hypothetical protein KJ069_29575 [Anaerolineae bacterium]|nr:hypothetical protein [Anaerolineae bacterium]